jgi:23S rRNA (uracil1939-C5)-methyltransferase
MIMNKEFELTLTGLVYGGDAIGRLPDGRAVFVPFGLPGERVLVRIVAEKLRHARATLQKVLEPSPQRITPRCVHFQVCGGCHYQHLSYADQLKVKEDVLREQFMRIAEMADVAFQPIRPAPSAWNYRSAMDLLLTAEGKPGYPKVGLEELVAITECHLPELALNDLWPRLEFEPGAGLDLVQLRQGSEEDLLLVLSGEEPNPPDFAVDLPLSVVYDSPVGEMVLSGENHVVVEMQGRLFKVSNGSPFPENRLQAEAMLRYGLELAGESRLGTILDVHCGVGLFSALFAEKATRLVGVEEDLTACEDFAANLDEFEQVELYQGAPEIILPRLNMKPDLVIVEPPGEGLEKQALDALAVMKAPRLIYVSSDPATLARDSRRLVKSGYRLAQVTPFDTDPQTYRMACVALFE